MARPAALTLSFRIDDEAVLAGLRKQRREINQDVKKVTLDAAKAQVLPLARLRAVPSAAKPTIIAKSTTRGAYLTTTARGTLRRVIGLQEYGGTVATVILPKSAQALTVGPGIIRARVDSPRTYRAKRFLRGSVDARFGAFTRHVERRITELMQSRITFARTFG